jgi:hypothetical protein
MALSKAKKDRIIADWKTGAYSQNALSKKHKVGVATVHRLTKGIPKGQNAHIVGAAEVLEEAKRKENGIEVQAALQVAKQRTERERLADMIYDGALKGTAKAVVKSAQALDRNLKAADIANHTRAIKTAVETAKLVTREEDAPQVVVNNQVAASATAGAQAQTGEALSAEDLRRELERIGLT